MTRHMVLLLMGLVWFAGLELPAAHAELKIHGFADIAGSSSSTEYTMDWLGNNGKQISFDGSTRVGLNLSADLTKQWDFAGQLVARGYGGLLGQSGYLVSADWLFLTYRPSDSWMLRGGRQIYPVFLFSEQIDVGFTYLWARLPAVVYLLIPVKSFNGLLGSYNLFYDDLQISASLYGGAGYFSQVSPGIAGLAIYDQQVKGANLSLKADNYKVSASYKISHPTGNFYVATPMGTQYANAIDLGTVYTSSLGTELNFKNFTFIGEGVHVSNEKSGVFKESGYYVTGAYHLFQGLLTPHITYGKQWSETLIVNHPDPTMAGTLGAGALQQDMTQAILGLNYRATNSVVLKLEYENVKLSYHDSSLNFGIDTYTVAVDAVF